MFARSLAVLSALVMTTNPSMASETVLLHAAGSLRAALTEVGVRFKALSGIDVQAKFGASGLLKDEILGGAKAQVFASANMEHPEALARANRSGPAVLFARNRLCALVRPRLAVTPATLLAVMLDPDVKLGTSTPKADPSGDYAWDVFHKADAIKPGAFETLEKKAIQLVGKPNGPVVPAGRTVYGMLVAQGAADLFLTYCTNAFAAQKENAGQQVVALPDSLAVGADYGLTVMSDASPGAYRFALFILSTEGQHVLSSHGFSTPSLPR
jgi:molybdate transport system substrate-binding protein